MNAMKLTSASKTYEKRSYIPKDVDFYILLQLQHLWLIAIVTVVSIYPETFLVNIFQRDISI